MDVSSRPQAPAPSARNTSGDFKPNTNTKKEDRKNKWWRIATVAMVVAVAILICAVIALTASGSNVKEEGKYVFKDKLQSVFLNNGQVYFGHISNLNNKYLVITDVYYLKAAAANNAANSADANNSTLTLVKLGCELHEPFDQIIINRDQVSFWENLQDNGQVTKAVETFQKQNPNGQKCVDQSNAASSNSTTNTQGTSAPATTTNRR